MSSKYVAGAEGLKTVVLETDIKPREGIFVIGVMVNMATEPTHPEEQLRDKGTTLLIMYARC